MNKLYYNLINKMESAKNTLERDVDDRSEKNWALANLVMKS